METETNAERLGELKNMVDAIDGDFTAQVFGYKLDGQKIVEDMKWLIEQAGREQKLEAKVESLQIENGGLREFQERLEGMWLYEKRCLQEENARLSDALEDIEMRGCDLSVEIAREALAGEKNGQC